MKKLVFVASFAVVLVLANPASAQVTMSPLATWSPNGDGWLAPGEGGYTFLGTGNLERGLGFGNGHVYLVSRNGGNNVRILDALTGADLGGLNMTGVSGGTFPVNNMGGGGGGATFVSDLTTTTTNPPYTDFKS